MIGGGEDVPRRGHLPVRGSGGQRPPDGAGAVATRRVSDGTEGTGRRCPWVVGDGLERPMLGRSPTEMHWAGSMPWPEEGLTHPKWLVSVVARQVAHYRKNGFVQTWPRVGRCPNDWAGLLWLSTAVGRFNAPGRKWAIVLGDLVLGEGWREGGMMAREG